MYFHVYFFNLQIHAHIYRSFIRHHKMLGVRIAKRQIEPQKPANPCGARLCSCIFFVNTLHQKQAILLENSLFLQLFHHIRSVLSFSIPHLNQFHLMPFSVLFVYNHARFFALSTTLIIFYQIQLDHNYNHSSTSDYRLFNRDIMHRIHIGIPFSVHLWLLCRRMIQAYKVTFTPHKDRLA